MGRKRRKRRRRSRQGGPGCLPWKEAEKHQPGWMM
jgi:hypothetical protein